MKNVDCFKCRHFKTTWNPQFPRACSAYGFKTKEIPSMYILKVSGENCLKFSPKILETNKTQKKTGKIDFNI